MSSVFTAIREVNSYLTLSAFVVAVLLYGYINWLRSREKRETAAIQANNELEIARIKSHYAIPTGNLPQADIKPVLLERIQLTARRNRLIATVLIVMVVVIGIVAVASFFVAPSNSPKASSSEGGLGTLVNAFNASPGEFTVTLADQSLTNFWVTDVAGANARAIVQKICNVNPCLACEPKEIGAAAHVIIRLGGKLESFRDSFGAIWQRCSSV